MSLLLRRRAMSRFSPLSIAWHSAFWASGPEFAALGLSDGAAVASWPDERNLNDASQGTAAARPTYRASGIGGKPAVDFDGVDDSMATAAFAAALAGPGELFAVVQADALPPAGATSFATIVNGIAGGSRWQLGLVDGPGTNDWYLAQGDPSVRIGGGAPDTASPHAILGVYAATDELIVDGASIATGNAGTESLTGLRFGSSTGGTASFFSGHLAFLGVYDGTLTAGQRSNLFSWSRSFYGTP